MKRLRRIGIALTTIAVLACSTLPVLAGDCGSYFSNYRYGYSYTPTYYPTVYYAEVVPVITPVALFQFVQPAPTVVSSGGSTLPGANGAAVGASAAAPISSSSFTDQQIKLLAVELAKALKGDQPLTEKSPAHKEGVKPQATAPNLKDKVALAHKVAFISASKCMECHTQGSEKGKVVLFNQEGQFGPSVPAQKMYDAVREDHMPDKGPKLTADEKDAFRQFVLIQ